MEPPGVIPDTEYSHDGGGSSVNSLYPSAQLDGGATSHQHPGGQPPPYTISGPGGPHNQGHPSQDPHYVEGDMYPNDGPGGVYPGDGGQPPYDYDGAPYDPNYVGVPYDPNYVGSPYDPNTDQGYPPQEVKTLDPTLCYTCQEHKLETKFRPSALLCLLCPPIIGICIFFCIAWQKKCPKCGWHTGGVRLAVHPARGGGVPHGSGKSRMGGGAMKNRHHGGIHHHHGIHPVGIHRGGLLHGGIHHHGIHRGGLLHGGIHRGGIHHGGIHRGGIRHGGGIHGRKRVGGRRKAGGRRKR